MSTAVITIAGALTAWSIACDTWARHRADTARQHVIAASADTDDLVARTMDVITAAEEYRAAHEFQATAYLLLAVAVGVLIAGGAL